MKELSIQEQKSLSGGHHVQPLDTWFGGIIGWWKEVVIGGSHC